MLDESSQEKCKTILRPEVSEQCHTENEEKCNTEFDYVCQDEIPTTPETDYGAPLADAISSFSSASSEAKPRLATEAPPTGYETDASEIETVTETNSFTISEEDSTSPEDDSTSSEADPLTTLMSIATKTTSKPRKSPINRYKIRGTPIRRKRVRYGTRVKRDYETDWPKHPGLDDPFSSTVLNSDHEFTLFDSDDDYYADSDEIDENDYPIDQTYFPPEPAALRGHRVRQRVRTTPMSYQVTTPPQPKVQCQYTPRQNCTQVPKQVCRQVVTQVPEQVCITVPVQTARQVCQNRTRNECEVVSRQEPTEECDVIETSTPVVMNNQQRNCQYRPRPVEREVCQDVQMQVNHIVHN